MEDVLPRRALIFEPPNLRLLGRREKLTQPRQAAASATMLYQLECNCRGFYQIGPLVMETGDLFGLHRRFRVASQPHFLMVYPQGRAAQRLRAGLAPAAGRNPPHAIACSRIRRGSPACGNIKSGDPLNRINWRATARTGQLHSKVYEASCVAGVTIVLDFHSASHDRPQDEPFRSELAITAAASLANAVYEMGQQVGLVSNCRDAADRIRIEGWDYRPAQPRGRPAHWRHARRRATACDR